MVRSIPYLRLHLDGTTFATTNPAMNPIKMRTGKKIIRDMLTSQKYIFRDTTSLFCSKRISKRTIMVVTTINFGLTIGYHFSSMAK